MPAFVVRENPFQVGRMIIIKKVEGTHRNHATESIRQNTGPDLSTGSLTIATPRVYGQHGNDKKRKTPMKRKARLSEPGSIRVRRVGESESNPYVNLIKISRRWTLAAKVIICSEGKWPSNSLNEGTV